MTDRELLECLTDRPCDVCKFHGENGCTQWACVFCDGLFGDMRTKQETSGDLISRDAVLDLVADYDLSMGQVVRGIHALPSVNPQEPKTGHWIMSDDGLYRPICDKCGAHPWKGYIPTVEEAIEVFKYCPNCGADMRGNTE